MSRSRKKDRYNETWTKEELTDSLRRGDRKSLRSKGDDRKRRDTGNDEKTRHKSRSRPEEDRHSHHDAEERRDRRDHRSRRENKMYDDDDRHDSSRKEREDGTRKRSGTNKEHDDVDSDRREHQRSSRHEDKSRHSEKQSSRYRESENRHDDYEEYGSKNSSRREAKESSRHHRKKDAYNDEEIDSREDKHVRHRRSKHEAEHHNSREKDSRHPSKHRSKYEIDDENDDGRSNKKHHSSGRDDDEYRRRRKEDKWREDKKTGEHRRHRKDERRKNSDEDIRDDRRRRRDRDREKLEEANGRRKDDDRHRRRDEKERHRNREERQERKAGHKTREEKYAKESDRYDQYGEKPLKSSRSKRDRYQDEGEQYQNSNSSKAEKDEYNYDGDEFEDYEDDFEDEGDAGTTDNANNTTVQHNAIKQRDDMDELMLALKSENERANSAQSTSHVRSYPTSDGNETPFSQSSYYSRDPSRNNSGKSATGPVTMINFSLGPKSNSTKTRKKMLKRIIDLQNLIQLESATFDVLDLPPVTEYNLYIKNYGNSNTTQASVQCNDDNLDQDSQTDIPDVDEKWTQHPPSSLKSSGGKDNVTGIDAIEDDRQFMLSTLRVDTLRVTKFMKRATKLVEAILNEDNMWKSSSGNAKTKSELSFCESVTLLQTNLPYLQGRRVVHITSSQGSSHNNIAVAFEPASHTFSTRIDRKGLIAVWDTRRPAIPERILVCDACPTYCCFGVGKSYILFTGTDDGCVMAFDLREPGVNHQIMSLEPTRETILRSATYSTGYLDDGHSSPIVSIMAIGAESKFSDDSQIIPQNIDRKSHSGLAFQVASLEEAARLFIWIVIEVLSETEASDDLGLAPHGKIKLIKSLSYNIPSPLKGIFPAGQFQTTCIQFSVIDPNNFYVGTDTGHIIHCTQYSASNEHLGNPASSSKDVLFNEIDSVSSVTSIDINPFQLFGSSLLLAGHDDGCLRLYLSDRKFPVINWSFSTKGASITKVQWSSIRPSVFFVLDSNFCLHVWDLAIMHAGPIKTELSNSKCMKNFSLSKASVSNSPEIAFIFEEASKEKSSLEVHKLAPHFTQVTDYQELDQLTFLIQSLL